MQQLFHALSQAFNTLLEAYHFPLHAHEPFPPCLHTCRLERKLLRNVVYYDDYCITHEDEDYMKQQYDIKLEQQDNYFVRTYPDVRA